MAERSNEKRVVLRGQTPGTYATARPGRREGTGGPTIYLLSPANSSGRRGQILLNPKADFELARRLRTTGITLGEAFSFMSALYFRGKLEYAKALCCLSNRTPGTLVITSSRGLLRPETMVQLEDLEEITAERILPDNPQYRDPLERDLRTLSEMMGAAGQAVLLGSIATRKYIPILLETLGERVFVPRKFIGLGNMSRGALLLRCAKERRELEYVPMVQALEAR